MSQQHWRNVLHCDQKPDAEMRAIDAQEAALADVPDRVRQIRGLISRFDSLTHYRAFDNLEFLLNAIGAQDYPGAPAVDVLSRAWEIDDERRARFKTYVRALTAWTDGDAIQGDEAEQVRAALGSPDDNKRWLAASLAKTLKAFAYDEADRLEEAPPAAFVRALYKAALGRDLSEDDLQNRLDELAAGKSRNALAREIYDSAESRQHQLHHLLHHLETE